MAVTDIQATVLRITGVTPTANSVEDAQMFVASKIPKDLLKWAITETVAASHGGNNSNQQITLPVKTDSLVYVRRDQFEASLVDSSMRGFIGNSNSLHLATDTFPKYYIADGNRVIVKPDPDNTYTAHAQYVDYSKIDDDSDLRNVVIFHAVAQEFEKLASGKIVDWSDLIIPVAPSSPDFSSNLSITSVSPAVPTLTSVTFSSIDSSVDASSPLFVTASVSAGSIYTGSAPTYNKPVFQDLAAPPSYNPPVMNTLDFNDADTWINTEEDSEMLASRVQVINAQISEFSAKVQNSINNFNEENSEYQADLQHKIQKSQSEIQNELNKFNKENVAFQAQVQESMQEIQVANQVNISKAQADLQVAIANADRSQQRQLQNAAQDMQAIVSDNENKLSKFQAEVGKFQASVSKEVEEYSQSLAKKAREYESKLGLYNADLQKYGAQSSEKAQKISSAYQNATHYSTQAKKYYEWAMNEVSMYIQNNSEMIERTMALRARNRGRRDMQQRR